MMKPHYWTFFMLVGFWLGLTVMLWIAMLLTGCTLTPDERVTRTLADMSPEDWEAVWADDGMAPPVQASQTDADRVMAELDAQMEGR